jgi:hypothetical protein
MISYCLPRYIDLPTFRISLLRSFARNLSPGPAMSAMMMRPTKTGPTPILRRTTLGMETAIAMRIAALPVRHHAVRTAPVVTLSVCRGCSSCETRMMSCNLGTLYCLRMSNTARRLSNRATFLEGLEISARRAGLGRITVSVSCYLQCQIFHIS